MKIRLSELNLMLGIAGLGYMLWLLIKEPYLFSLSLLLIIPGFLLTYLFSKEGFTSIERLALSAAISNVFLIAFRAFTNIGLVFSTTTLWIILIGLPIVFALLNYRFFSAKLKTAGDTISKGKIDLKSPSIQSTSEFFMVLGIAALLTMIVWGGLLQDKALPLTDQVINQAFINTFKTTIEGHGSYPYWTSEYSGGFPLVLFDSPFYYERPAIDSILISGYNLTTHMNYYSFLSFIILLAGSYALAKRLGWSKLAGVAAMALFITSPLIASKCGYSGDMKEMTSFAIFPIAFAILIMIKDRKEYPLFILLGILLATYYFTNLVPLIASALVMALYYIGSKLIEKERVSKREMIGFALAGATALLLVALNLVPMALSLKYGTPESWTYDYGKNLSEFYNNLIKPMMSAPVTKPYDQYSHNMGMFFSLLAFAGMALSIYKRRWKEGMLALAFWLMMLFYLVPGLKTIMTHVESQRLVLLILLVFSLFIGRLIDLFKGPLVKGAIAIIIIILIAATMPTTIRQAHAWVGEQAQNGLLLNQYKFLEQFGHGRVINYGIFSYATEPFVPAISNLWMITHTTGVGARTTPQYDLKDGSESALPDDKPIEFVINRMQSTFTRYVIVIKEPGRRGDVTYQVISDYLKKTYNVSALHDDTQHAMFMVPDSYYAISVVPMKTSLTKEEINSVEGGWKFATFGMSSKATDFEGELTSVEQIAMMRQPAMYSYSVPKSGEIILEGDFSGEWINIREHYFPTWRAEQAGNQLRIEESNYGTILVKSEVSDQPIMLYHELPMYEKLLSILALIALPAAFLIAWYLSNKEEKNHNHDKKKAAETPEDIATNYP